MLTIDRKSLIITANQFFKINIHQMIRLSMLCFTMVLLCTGCDLKAREEALQKKEAELAQKEQELTLKEKSLQIREEELTQLKQKLDSVKTKTDTEIVYNQQLTGEWNV